MDQQYPTPHKHAACIKAWADGHAIQFRRPPAHPFFDGTWADALHPQWHTNAEYRVKPTKKPDRTTTRVMVDNSFAEGPLVIHLQYTIDGESGMVTKVEVTQATHQ